MGSYVLISIHLSSPLIEGVDSYGRKSDLMKFYRWSSSKKVVFFTFSWKKRIFGHWVKVPLWGVSNPFTLQYPMPEHSYPIHSLSTKSSKLLDSKEYMRISFLILFLNLVMAWIAVLTYDAIVLCSFVTVYALTIQIPIRSGEVFVHDLYSITVLINLYRCILINFDDFLDKRLITLAQTRCTFLFYFSNI